MTMIMCVIDKVQDTFTIIHIDIAVIISVILTIIIMMMMSRLLL